MIKTGLLLIAHGSKDPEWIKPFKAIENEIRKHFSGPLILTYLESTTPRIEEGLAHLIDNGATYITVAPLFLAAGSHVRSDIPNLIDGFRSRKAGVSFRILPAIGHLPAIQELIASEVIAQIELQSEHVAARIK